MTSTPVAPEGMARLVAFLRTLADAKFFGTLTVRCEAGRAVHVEVSTLRRYEYKDLPS